MKSALNWRERLYQAYISSGQAQVEDISHALKERQPAIEAITVKHIPAKQDISILDLGCGYGALIYFLKKAGYTYLKGVDFSQEQVDLAHELGSAW
jgi:SAM-dependent methyltransferase